MNSEKDVFEIRGIRPYLLRYGAILVPALLTIFGSDFGEMMLIMGIGLIVSGIAQWLLAHFENAEFLSTTWSISRAKLKSNQKAKNDRQRQKQIDAKRTEAINRAKREGKLLGIGCAVAGACVTLYGIFGNFT